jgi:hypothetical protein
LRASFRSMAPVPLAWCRAPSIRRSTGELAT